MVDLYSNKKDFSKYIGKDILINGFALRWDKKNPSFIVIKSAKILCDVRLKRPFEWHSDSMEVQIRGTLETVIPKDFKIAVKNADYFIIEAM